MVLKPCPFSPHPMVKPRPYRFLVSVRAELGPASRNLRREDKIRPRSQRNLKLDIEGVMRERPTEHGNRSVMIVNSEKSSTPVVTAAETHVDWVRDKS